MGFNSAFKGLRRMKVVAIFKFNFLQFWLGQNGIEELKGKWNLCEPPSEIIREQNFCT